MRFGRRHPFIRKDEMFQPVGCRVLMQEQVKVQLQM